MPKNPTFQLCLDETKQISVADLTRFGYLREQALVSGSLDWTKDGKSSSSITVEANLSERYVELRYVYLNGPMNCRVRLESVKRHFGGWEWYFVCPFANKRCKKLYLIDGHFLSRYACPSAMYRSQTYSKLFRSMFAEYHAMDSADQFFSKPYARTHYKGKMTKRYARLLKRERRVMIGPAVRRSYYMS